MNHPIVPTGFGGNQPLVPKPLAVPMPPAPMMPARVPPIPPPTMPPPPAHLMPPRPIVPPMAMGMPPAPPGVPMAMGLPMTPPPAVVAPVPPLIAWFTGPDLIGPPPTRQWLVPDMIPMNTVTLLYGDGGTGKSLIALQLAASVALGRLWFNRMPITGPTIYISAEDDRAELHRRLDNIARSMNVTVTALIAITIADLAGKDALLASINRKGLFGPTALFELIMSKVRDVRPRMIVIDTLADVYPGNENDRMMVRQFVGLMRGIAINSGCAVVLLAHPSLTGIATGTGASGSTAWNNSVRSRLYFERIKDGDYEPNPDARRLKVMKSNYGRTGIEINVVWKDNIFIAEQDGGSVDANARAERVFMTMLERSNLQGRTFSPNYAPNEFSKMPNAEGMSKKSLKDAMERLFANGKIIIEKITENSRERSIITLGR